MSDRRWIEIDDHGLAMELAGAAAAIEAALLRAGEQSADVVGPAIAGQTPVRSGDLKGSERAYATGPVVMFEATVEYASYVQYGTSRQAANPYIDRGVRQSEVEVELIYAIGVDRALDGFDQ